MELLGGLKTGGSYKDSIMAIAGVIHSSNSGIGLAKLRKSEEEKIM